MRWNFPETIFVKQNGIATQAYHILSEAKELNDACTAPDIWAVAMENMDVLHAAETGLRILQKKYGIDLAKLRRDCEAKNALRFYYHETEEQTNGITE